MSSPILTKVTKGKILIVEDEALVAQELKQSLSAQGHDVWVAETGEEAVEQVAAAAPNLVLLDIVLPGAVDGVAVAAQLQQLDIPVIYITGHLDRTLFDRARETEPFAFLLKPLQQRELSRMVELALFRRQREQEREREREQQARKLRESEERFRLLVESVTDHSIFTLDTEGRVSTWNSGAERITGYRAEAVLGKFYGIFFTKEDLERDVPLSELRQARVSGSADDTRWLLRQDGAEYWGEGTLSAIRDSQGTIIGFAKVTRDTTERRQMEEALRERDERLRVALHAARTGTWKWDLRTNLDTIDESLKSLFGLEPGQDIKTIDDFYRVVHPDDREQVKASFERTLREGAHLEIEFRVVWPDGSEHWLLDQGEVARDADGQPLYFSGACVDITRRREADEALRASEKRFRLYAENVRDYALLQLDAEGRIVTWNTGAERVLGYAEPEILGRSVKVLFTPEDNAAGESERELKTALATGRAIDERWHMRKDGSRFWASGAISSVLDERGRLQGFAKVMRDETERRRAEEALRASLKEKEILLQEIHHRVKNNLQVITSLLRLQSEHLTDEHTRGAFEEARNRVQAIGAIHELLYKSPDLARIDFGTYLNRLVNDLLSFYGKQDEVKLVTDVTGESLEINQAIPCGLLVNELTTNCLKHAFPMRRRGTIRVALWQAGGECRLSVEDDGVGLPEALDWEDSPTLGLQLVIVLTKQLDGRVEVQRLNPGTRFEIVFPLATTQEETRPS